MVQIHFFLWNPKYIIQNIIGPYIIIYIYVTPFIFPNTWQFFVSMSDIYLHLYTHTICNINTPFKNSTILNFQILPTLYRLDKFLFAPQK